jgi:hypothetical protein
MASSIVGRLAPSDDITLDPHVFASVVKPYLYSDAFPASARISRDDLILILNAHIMDKGGAALTDPEIADLDAMKTYYTTLSPSVQTSYLDALESVSMLIQQGLLALTKPDPAGFWDTMFLGLGAQVDRALTRQAETTPDYENDPRFVSAVERVVARSDLIDGLSDKASAAVQQAGQAEQKAADAEVLVLRHVQGTANARAMAKSSIDQLANVRNIALEGRSGSKTALVQNAKQQQQINVLQRKR